MYAALTSSRPHNIYVISYTRAASVISLTWHRRWRHRVPRHLRKHYVTSILIAYVIPIFITKTTCQHRCRHAIKAQHDTHSVIRYNIIDTSTTLTYKQLIWMNRTTFFALRSYVIIFVSNVNNSPIQIQVSTLNRFSSPTSAAITSIK